jgi:hypothetical protein
MNPEELTQRVIDHMATGGQVTFVLRRDEDDFRRDDRRVIRATFYDYASVVPGRGRTGIIDWESNYEQSWSCTFLLLVTHEPMFL